jgi:ubiquinone/menaquinone biosynthesis C-methylase UbiE
MQMTSLLVPPRHDQKELLDQGAGTSADVKASFDDLWRINRFLGGIPALTRYLFPRLRALDGLATIADIGTGSAEIPALLARWAGRHGLRLSVLGLDLSTRHLEIARNWVQPPANVHLVHADARRLPLRENSVDYVISSLFLHHFTPEEVIELLREAYARARRGILMCDVERNWLPLLGFKIVQPIFARSYITRFDAVASVRRAYTPSEFRQMAAAAGLSSARVYRHPLWRMTLVADKA